MHTRAKTCWLLVLALLLLLCGTVRSEPVHDQALLAQLAQAPTAKEYPNDAAAWLLRDMAITVAEDGALTVQEHKLLTLLTTQALSLANWQIPYDKSCETLQIPLARTLNGGDAFPVAASQIVESALYPGLAWYDALTVRRFPLPAARIGATLEVTSRLHRAVPRMPGDFCMRLQLQDVLPDREGTLHHSRAAAPAPHHPFYRPTASEDRGK